MQARLATYHYTSPNVNLLVTGNSSAADKTSIVVKQRREHGLLFTGAPPGIKDVKSI